ncbi:MAG: hypothetical protein R3E65_00830 [Steroidobacteraceae bacterium]
MYRKLLIPALAAALLAVGCANQKEPATQAVASAESALAEVRDQAAYAGAARGRRDGAGWLEGQPRQG